MIDTKELDRRHSRTLLIVKSIAVIGAVGLLVYAINLKSKNTELQKRNDELEQVTAVGQTVSKDFVKNLVSLTTSDQQQIDRLLEDITGSNQPQIDQRSDQETVYTFSDPAKSSSYGYSANDKIGSINSYQVEATFGSDSQQTSELANSIGQSVSRLLASGVINDDLSEKKVAEFFYDVSEKLTSGRSFSSSDIITTNGKRLLFESQLTGTTPSKLGDFRLVISRLNSSY